MQSSKFILIRSIFKPAAVDSSHRWTFIISHFARHKWRENYFLFLILLLILLILLSLLLCSSKLLRPFYSCSASSSSITWHKFEARFLLISLEWWWCTGQCAQRTPTKPPNWVRTSAQQFFPGSDVADSKCPESHGGYAIQYHRSNSAKWKILCYYYAGDFLHSARRARESIGTLSANFPTTNEVGAEDKSNDLAPKWAARR